MPDITDRAGGDRPQQRGLSPTRQIAWFIGLYCAGLLATAVVVYFFRALLRFI